MSAIVQRTEALQTHLGVFLQDEHVADFSKVEGTEDLNLELLYSYPISQSPFPHQQSHWSYRGQAAICHMPNQSCVQLDGATGYIQFGDIFEFPGTAAFTVGGWFRPSALPSGTGYMLTKRSATTSEGGWYVGLTNIGQVIAGRMDSSGTDQAASSVLLSVNNWYWIVVTYDGSNIRIYVNAVLVATEPSTKSLPGNSLQMTMGRHAGGPTNFLGGRFYGWFLGFQPFSAGTIQSIYNNCSTGNGLYISGTVGQAGLTSFFCLNEPSGTLTDFRGAVAGGTATGGVTRQAAGPTIFPARTGLIYRRRIGNGDPNDRQIYSQIIYNPFNSSQYTQWNTAYSGDHYAIDLFEKDEVIYTVHAKSDGLYLNNSKKIDMTGIVRINCVAGRPGSLYLVRVVEDTDGNRTMDSYYVDDITAVSPTAVYDKINYRWPHQETAAFQWTSGSSTFVHRIRSLPYSAPSVRTPLVSDDLIQEYVSSSNVSSDLGNIIPMRAASGRAGVKYIDKLWVSETHSFPRSKTYLFFTERHTDAFQNPLSNLHNPVFMMRTGYPIDGWTEPHPLGFSLWGLAGAAYWGDYIILFGNGAAYMTVADTTETDLSNYALNAELTLPRGSERATGQCMLANPDDVIGQLIGMLPNQMSTVPQRRVRMVIGQRRSTEEDWEDVEINDWWVSEAHRISEDGKHHIGLRLSDFWQRLSMEFRDPYYFPGHIEALEWYYGGDQSTENWYTPEGTMTRVNDTDSDGNPYTKLRVSKGWCVYTKWKGAHCRFSVHVAMSAAGPFQLAFRWVDAKNYWRVYYSGSTLRLQQVVNGTATTLSTTSVTANQTSFTIRVEARFGWIRYSLGGTSGSYQETGTAREDQYGFVALHSKSANVTYQLVQFRDYEQKITTSGLVKFLLIYAGYFEFDVSEDLREIEQLGVLWGPQTDILTPSKALERLLEGNQLDVVWRPKSTADGRGQIVIRQLEDLEPLYDIDDEIISIDQADLSELRPNIIAVDGNEHSWTEYSRGDIHFRGAPVAKYLDLPELTTATEVRTKAQEEKTYAVKGNSLGGTCVWRPWFRKFDPVTWTDHDGNYYIARIEGMTITVDQGTEPFQRAELDLSPISVCDPEADESGVGPGTGGSGDEGEVVQPSDFIAKDDFNRADVTSSWGTAEVGGSWTLTGTASNFSIKDEKGRISTASIGSIRQARLGSVSELGPMYLRCRITYENHPESGQYTKSGILFRYIDADNHYRVNLSIGVDGKTFLQIYKVVAGVTTQLASREIAKTPTSLVAGRWLRVWVRGTSPTRISVKAWKTANSEPDSWTLEATDSSSALQNAGSVALWQINTGDSFPDPIAVRYDRFEVTEAPSS